MIITRAQITLRLINLRLLVLAHGGACPKAAGAYAAEGAYIGLADLYDHILDKMAYC